MKKMRIGFFGCEKEAEKFTAERLFKAAIALGCVTDEEIAFGVDCLKRIVTIEPEYSFDDYGGVESKMYVLKIKDY